jgi:hypothetical protein
MYRKILLVVATFFLTAWLFAQRVVTINDNNILKQQTAKIYGSINQYDYKRYDVLTNSNRFLLKEKMQQSLLNTTWQITAKATGVNNIPDAVDYTVTFKCMSGSIAQASVSIDIEFNNWSVKNYVLMPSVAYNGNKYKSKKLRYSPKLHDIKDIGIDKPIIINDVPKLNEGDGFSRIQERSGSMATPSIGFINDSLKKGVWLLTKQRNQWGDYGVSVEESRDRKKAVISLISPVVRELFNYVNCDAHNTTWDVPANFKAGDVITFTFRLYNFDAPETQSIFNKYAAIRKDIIADTLLRNALPYSECMQTLETKFNQQNFVSQYGYYAIGMRENYLQDWQIGWTGGMISTYPLLFAGNDTTVKRVIQNFDWLFANGISPSGFYWDAGQKGTEWFGGDIRNAHTKNWHLIRKSGDAVWYITKQFMLMEKKGIAVKPLWKDGNKKVCDAFVKLWNKYHQLGQFIDSQTGEIIVGGSSSGGIAPAALMLASQYYNETLYATTAKEIADYYNENFVKKGISCGGPGDALQAFDSESAYALVESYVTLYELTAAKKWLTIAENAAKQFATWVVSYNYQYNDTTAFYKADIKTIGGVYANIQNKHSAPGICTASGIGLLKLYRFTGDIFYLKLLQDIAHNITQYLPHPKKPHGNVPIGWVSERVNMTDWEGSQSIGYILPISTWAETSLMLTTIEIPGLYVQAHKGLFIAFDNINVTKISDTKDAIVLQLKNTTPVDAVVSIMQDDELSIKKAIGENVLYLAKKITLKAGAVKDVSFGK